MKQLNELKRLVGEYEKNEDYYDKIRDQNETLENLNEYMRFYLHKPQNTLPPFHGATAVYNDIASADDKDKIPKEIMFAHIADGYIRRPEPKQSSQKRLMPT